MERLDLKPLRNGRREFFARNADAFRHAGPAAWGQAAYSPPNVIESAELFSNGASAAWSRKAAELAPFVNNSVRCGLGRLVIWSQTRGAGMARPATTNKPRTLDVSVESVGQDERAAQRNESSDASKLNGSSISPSPLDRLPCRTQPMKNNHPEYAAHVGLDWADRAHQICLRAVNSSRDEQTEIRNTPEALHGWANALRTRFPGGKIAVAVEQSRGPVIYALSMHEHLELFPLNPAIAAKYREAAKAASGTKNDPLDASLQCELVRVHRDWLRPLAPLPTETRELVLLVEARRMLVEQRTALSHQLKAALKGYYPQALTLVNDDLGTALAWAFLRRWPTLAAVQRARPQSLRDFYHTHHVRSAERIEACVKAARAATALTNDAAVLATQPVLVAALVAQLQALQPSIDDYDARIAACFARQPDAALFASFPGAGTQLAPRLAAAFGSDRSRYESVQELQQYSGIAPVQESSGQKSVTHWRWHCPKFLRQTFHEIARCSIRKSSWARAYYQLQLDRGKTQQQAFRALAYKWQRVMFRCWQDRKPYDEAFYLAALRKRGSPLVPFIDALAA